MDADGGNSTGPRPGEGLERRLLDDALLGAQHNVVVVHVFLVVKVFHVDDSPDPIARLNADEVLNRPALGCLGALRNLVHFLPEHLPQIGENKQIVVCQRDEQVLCKVVFLGGYAPGPHATTSLGAIVGKQGAFDIPLVGYRDHHFLVGDHILRGNVVFARDYFSPTVITVAVAELFHFVLDDLHSQGFIRQDVSEPGDELLYLLVFLLNFFALEPGQALQAHVEYGLGLDFRKAKTLYETGTGRVRIGRTANQGDYFVEVVERNEISFQDMCPPFRFRQCELGTPDVHVMSVVDEILDKILQVKGQRPALDQRHVIDAEGRLQRCVLVKVVQYDVTYRVLLEIVHDAEPLPVGLVSNVRNAFDNLVVYQGRRLLDHLGLVHLVGNLRNDDLFPTAGAGHDLCPPAHDDPPTPGKVGFAYALNAVNDTTRRKIRGSDVFHELGNGDVVVINVGCNAVHHLPQVVGRHVCGHAHGNPGGTVY